MGKWRWICALLVPICLAAAGPPRPAPAYTVTLDGGKTFTLAQYKGRPVVLAFILTYCTHCQETVGMLSKFQSEYGPRGLQVLASAIDPAGIKVLPAFLKEFKPAFPVGYSAGEAALAFMQHAAGKTPYLPMLTFIDSQGMIHSQHEGDDAEFFGPNQEQNLRREIEALLKDMPAAKR